MAGIMLPSDATKLISALKKNSNLEIQLHTHATAGISEMLYLKAIEAGVDIIDTALSVFAGGTSQPATESLYYALEGTEYDLKLNIKYLEEAVKVLTPVRNKFVEEGGLNPKALMLNPGILKYQVPGGMLSNLMSQLTQQNAMDKYEEVLEEIPSVRAEFVGRRGVAWGRRRE